MALGMKCGNDDVGRKDGITSRGMPVAIDGAALHLRTAKCDLAQSALAIEDSASAFASQIEEAVLATVATVGVAVHAAVAQLSAVGQKAMGEVLGATLLDANIVPNLIAWFDKTIGDERIDAVGRDGPCEVGVSDPPAIVFAPCSQCDVHSLADMAACQHSPSVLVEDDFPAFVAE